MFGPRHFEHGEVETERVVPILFNSLFSKDWNNLYTLPMSSGSADNIIPTASRLSDHEPGYYSCDLSLPGEVRSAPSWRRDPELNSRTSPNRCTTVPSTALCSVEGFGGTSEYRTIVHLPTIGLTRCWVAIHHLSGDAG